MPSTVSAAITEMPCQQWYCEHNSADDGRRSQRQAQLGADQAHTQCIADRGLLWTSTRVRTIRAPRRCAKDHPLAGRRTTGHRGSCASGRGPGGRAVPVCAGSPAVRLPGMPPFSCTRTDAGVGVAQPGDHSRATRWDRWMLEAWLRHRVSKVDSGIRTRCEPDDDAAGRSPRRPPPSRWCHWRTSWVTPASSTGITSSPASASPADFGPARRHPADRLVSTRSRRSGLSAVVDRADVEGRHRLVVVRGHGTPAAGGRAVAQHRGQFGRRAC